MPKGQYWQGSQYQWVKMYEISSTTNLYRVHIFHQFQGSYLSVWDRFSIFAVTGNVISVLEMKTWYFHWHTIRDLAIDILLCYALAVQLYVLPKPSCPLLVNQWPLNQNQGHSNDQAMDLEALKGPSWSSEGPLRGHIPRIHAFPNPANTHLLSKANGITRIKQRQPVSTEAWRICLSWFKMLERPVQTNADWLPV